MSKMYEEEKNNIIQAVADHFAKKLNKTQATLCGEFVKQFFATISLDDLKESSIEDLYGLVINLWALMEERKPEQSKIKVYNPTFEQHGWQSTHTIVALICDDMPFLVDSLRIVIKRLGLGLYLTIHMGGIRLVRDAQHHITAVLSREGEPVADMLLEAPILMKIERQTNPNVLAEIECQLHQVLIENRAVVDDWQIMRDQIGAITRELANAPKTINSEEIEETKAFLNWMEDHHFTFVGMRDYALVRDKKDITLQPVPNTGYGVLRDGLSKENRFNDAVDTPQTQEQVLSSQILVASKTDTLSSIHRDAYIDYVGVKRFNQAGEVIGERRILGLYTSAAYNSNPVQIPFLRHKVAAILEQSKLNSRSHAGRILLNILETLPRDDLIQGSPEELLSISMGIFYMQERRRIRMFSRLDMYHRFISCLVYVPKDVYNSDLRIEMQHVLVDCFHATSATFTTNFSESIMARIHFMIRIDPTKSVEFDYKEIESKLVEVGRSWLDDLHQLLIESVGEEKAGQLHGTYKIAFPPVYKASFSPRTAVIDISHIEALSETTPLTMSFYRHLDVTTDIYRLKLYQNSNTIPLSDVLPIIENLGLRAISERPYLLKFETGHTTWINDFSLEYRHHGMLNMDEIKDVFQQAFASIWFGETENDGFNQLILASGLHCRQVAVLRMYAKYFKQIGLTFSQEYIERALLSHAHIAKKLFELFDVRFNVDYKNEKETAYEAIKHSILEALETVTNLDEDKIIRQFMTFIGETLRTNYYQKDAEGKFKTYISIKLNSKGIPGLPKPHPLYEIFVYSPQFEAIHLRSSKVARGGLRWSDRREDFRTEVLGLMKAQQVKNAVIVPNGAKGGFVVKTLPASNATREDIMAEGIRCYQQFIRGLLDITDNNVAGKIKKPTDVVCYDGDDAYLVVAADKGTATFSDIANEISEEYQFWLGDAFASGGSVGYDHKKMGITARGAWESVHRHCYVLGIDIDTTDFTVIGIGDMAGDVFGNGMLLSPHIKLVAAFNHLHIFIDPTPDAAQSFEERKRLFYLPRSSWEDYNRGLISQGGGIFSRFAKSIEVTPEMATLLGLKEKAIEPNELLKSMLRANVDLLWSGGIGTFVKAKSETNADAGDRTNDLIRVNAKQLRAKAVAEGGNLGFTQLARVEYALNGGLIYTDFIDNSAGVSCSDKEVNIKILLNSVMSNGDLTYKQRNTLLSQMTDEVAQLVLRDNYLQTRSINLSVAMAVRAMELNIRYLNDLQRSGKLDRHLEFLPDDKHLHERKAQGVGLTSSEVAVLMCYTKILLKEAILDSELPEDPYLKRYLIRAFPHPLQQQFTDAMQQHPLRREIIATNVSNLIVNEMGFGFAYRVQTETGALMPAIVRAYIIARSVFDMDSVTKNIESLDNCIKADDQINLMITYVRLLRRATRWFLNTKRVHLNIEQAVLKYQKEVSALRETLPQCLGELYQSRFEEHYETYCRIGVPESLALELTRTRGLFAAMDIVDIAHETQSTITEASEAFFGVGEFLDLGWLREQIIIHATENNWEALAREALRDDLDMQQRLMTTHVLGSKTEGETFAQHLQIWTARNIPQIERWNEMMKTFKTTEKLSPTMFFVAVREFFSFDT